MLLSKLSKKRYTYHHLHHVDNQVPHHGRPDPRLYKNLIHLKCKALYH